MKKLLITLVALFLPEAHAQRGRCDTQDVISWGRTEVELHTVNYILENLIKNGSTYCNVPLNDSVTLNLESEFREQLQALKTQRDYMEIIINRERKLKLDNCTSYIFDHPKEVYLADEKEHKQKAIEQYKSAQKNSDYIKANFESLQALSEKNCTEKH